jgi:HSP20 family molecular chaperone IbpA
MTRETSLAKQQPQSMVQSDQRPAIAPECDIYESNDEILLVADLPGVSTNALKINIDNGELALEARREVASSGTLLGGELRDCDFRRRFAVPPGIDGARINAELRNGVLSLHLPKSDALKPRQISVRAG